MRLMLVCTRATKLPSAMVSTAITATTTTQISAAGAMASRKMRSRMAKAAAFGPTDMKAVMVVGAPS